MQLSEDFFILKMITGSITSQTCIQKNGDCVLELISGHEYGRHFSSWAILHKIKRFTVEHKF